MTESESSALTVATPQSESGLGLWASAGTFELAQRMAAALAGGCLLPDPYRADKVGGQTALSNCLMLLSLAQRLQMDPFLVGQNMVPINGRPAFSSAFVIALINRCGRFAPLRFEYAGEGDARACRALAMDRQSRSDLEGNWVSVKMAKDFGWWSRSGSQWSKNTDQLLAYRAAGWFGRLHCPEVLLGVASREDVIDAVIELEATPAPAAPEPEPVATEVTHEQPQPSAFEEAIIKIPAMRTSTQLGVAQRRARALLDGGHITEEEHQQIEGAITTRAAELAQQGATQATLTTPTQEDPTND